MRIISLVLRSQTLVYDQSMSETGAKLFKPPGNEYFYPPVRPDLMRLAIEAFWSVLRNTPADDRNLFRKAAAKVEKVVQEDWRNQMSYVGRCHAFRNLINAIGFEGFRQWVTPAKDGSGYFFHDVVYEAVATTPIRGRGTRFLKTDFMAAVERIVATKKPSP
jgi:hypothetical protein